MAHQEVTANNTMKLLFNLKSIATGILACSTCSQAATVAYSWSSPSNLGTETGTLSASIPGQGTGTGETVNITGTLAAPTITLNDGAAPSGFIGQQTSYTTAANNVTMSTHFGWSGTVNLVGVDSMGNSYSLPVSLTYEDGDSIAASYTATDSGAAVDSVGLTRFALWPGENSSGHRVSGPADTFTFAAGADTFSVTGSRNPITGANAGSTIGDNLGTIIGIRDEPATSGTVFYSGLSINGNLDEDDAGIVFTPVPEPSSVVLLSLATLGLVGRRRK